MSPRQFAVPVTTLLLSLTVATTTTACSGDGIMGDWLATGLEIDGEDYSSILDGYSETYDGCTYTSSTSFRLEFDEKDGDTVTGEFRQTYSYSYSGACDEESYTEGYSYDAEATKGDEGNWDIDIDDVDFDMNCVIEGDEMECDSEFYGSDATWTFEKG
jgi:hypothetical protein